MVVIVSLITAAAYGAGDFLGGVASKRIRVVEVVAGSQAVGLIGATVVAVAIGATFSVESLVLGAAAGLLGGIGVWTLYRRLAIGPMHVVAPITAVASAVVPAMWGFLIGEQLSTAVILGLVAALAAIALVSSGQPEPGRAPVDARCVLEALTAGVGFGGLFIVFDATEAATAPYPVVGARLATSLILLGVLVVGRLLRAHSGDLGVGRDLGAVVPGVESPDRVVVTGSEAGDAKVPTRWLPWIVVAVGLLDTGANIGFLYATSRGSLAVASVLTSLYPVSTVLLARFVLGEQTNGRQRGGLALAVFGSTMIAVG